MKKVTRIPMTASFLFDSCDFTGSVCKVYSCGDSLYLKMDGNIYRMTKEEVESLSGRIVDFVKLSVQDNSSGESEVLTLPPDQESKVVLCNSSYDKSDKGNYIKN